jgi:Ca-activated chloride channel family protein
MRFVTASLAAIVLSIVAGASPAARQERPTGQGFSFRTGVELVNVTATVTDDQGRFVSGLTADDFEIYEDGKPQQISLFETERVPVSLGLVLDTSGSMVGERIAAAQAAVSRFLNDLLGEQDEVFLYRFDSRPRLVHGWTDDRRAVGDALGSVTPGGGTAMYDAVAESLPLAQSGTRRKKALVVISDGNDTSSRTDVDALRTRIRESELLVYAIGIDASGAGAASYGATATGSLPAASAPPRPRNTPVPSAFPGAPVIRTPPKSTPTNPPRPAPRYSGGERFNVDALRALTDDSGGRTEIIMSPRDLGPATAGIASELSRQYFLGYSSALSKDGRWHEIEVKVRRGNYTVRARRGFIATR